MATADPTETSFQNIPPCGSARSHPAAGGESQACGTGTAHPLTLPQRDIWFEQQLHPDTPLYNMGGYMRLNGPIDAGLFIESTRWLVHRHDALRTRLVRSAGTTSDATAGVPSQCFANEGDLPLEVLDFSGQPEPEEAAKAWMAQRFEQPFTLLEAPLFRYALLRLGPASFLYFACYHHLVADGWTVALLARSHAQLYTALSRGEAPGPPAPSYRDFIDDDLAYLRSPSHSADRDHWRGKLAAQSEPLLSPRLPVPAHGGGAPSRCETARLPQQWYGALGAFAKAHGSSTFQAILAALQVYFSRTGRRDEVTIGMPVLNRSNAAFRATAGLFVSVTALRLPCDMGQGFAELLRAMARQLRQDYRHQRFPISALSRGGAVHQPLFDILVSYERHDHEAVFGGTHGSAVPMANGHLPTPLSIYVREFHADADVQLDFVYKTTHFSADEVRAIQQRLVHLLDAAQHDPLRPVHALPLQTPAEVLRVAAWQGVVRPREASGLLDRFDDQVRRHPARTAVAAGGETLRYDELDRRANRLTRTLAAHHQVGPDTRVALCMERSIHAVVAMLAVLKAGGAYVPLDPGHPAERLGAMLDDAGPALLLTQAHLLDRLSWAHAPKLCVDAPGDGVDLSGPCEKPAGAPSPGDLAYVIYTSGSTGRPKGVMVTRANLLHSTLARLDHYEQPVQGFLMPSSFAFDSSVAGIFWTLFQGGTLCLPAEAEHNDPAALARLVASLRPTHLLCIPSLYLLLLDAASPGQLGSLNTVIVAGEACGVELAARHHDHFSGAASLFNEYGPTEMSVWSTVYQCPPPGGGRLGEATVPIGRPIGNLRAHLLDTGLSPVPPGVVAEVYLSGEGVARGYLDRPDWTAERFLPCPFSDEPGARMYQTGDLGRWREDGQLEFLGRVDTQVKVRGFRVEMAEIEAALTADPMVSEAAAVLRADHSDGPAGLAAHVTLRGPALDGLGRSLRDAQVQAWRKVYDASPAQAPMGSPDMDLVGWNSSYSGEPIPEAEMADLVSDTVLRIASLRPRRVLEVGCGTGLLLLEVAPRCEAYVGMDFSAAVLSGLQPRVRATGLDHVRLLHGAAHELSALGTERFDTIVLNSVAQYFPDAGYLTEVLRSALGLLEPGGQVFVGDVRHFGLLDAFHASVQAFKAGPGTPVDEVRARVSQAIDLEKELLVSPEYFEALPGLLPAVQAVRVLPKVSRHANELVKYRYDVVLQLGALPGISGYVHLDWSRDGLSPRRLARLLATPRAQALCVTHVPNRLVREDAAAIQRLQGGGVPADGLTPCELQALAERAGLHVELSWLRGDAAGSYHALFRPQAEQGDAVAFPVDALARPIGCPTAPGAHTNEPLRGAVQAEAVRALQRALERTLPRHMQPDQIVILRDMPRTPNGKVDRKALGKAPPRRRQGGGQAPGTATEQRLAALWAELLQCGPAGLDDNFFALGGHSLLAARLVTRLRKDASVDVPLRAVFDHPVLRDLARHIDTLLADPADAETPPRPAGGDRRGPWPLSFAQQRLWFLHQLAPGSASYNMPGGAELRGVLDVPALRAALDGIAARHEVLRTRFEAGEGGPAQGVDPRGGVPLEEVDLSSLPLDEALAQAHRLARQAAERPFDLQAEPPVRACLLKLQPGLHWLVLCLHHIAADGWSMPIFLREIAILYSSSRRGAASPATLPALPLQYADFAAWQRTRAHGQRCARDLRYWRAQLADAPASLALPFDHPRPAAQAHQGARVAFTVPRALRERLEVLSGRQGATLFMTLLGAFGILLWRHSGQQDLCIGTPVANRRHADLDGLVGCFVNTLVMRLKPVAEQGFGPWLGQVRETALAAYGHQDAPFEQLVQALAVERDLGHSPLFQVMFSLQNAGKADFGLEGLATTLLEIELPIAKFDLSLELRDDDAGGGLHGTFEYDTALFERASVERFAGRFQALLEDVAERPAAALSRLRMLPEAEHRFLLGQSDRSGQDFPLNDSYAALFAAQAARRPGKVAVECMGERLTYGELDRCSNRIARALAAAGAGPDVLVGAMGERGLCHAAVMIGILKAAAAYVPLDVLHPVNRLREIVQRSRMGVLIAWRGSAHLLEPLTRGLEATPRVLIAEDVWLEGDAAPLPPRGSPDSLAYVIFTSGSTGRPKGAMVECRGMLNNLFGKVPALGLHAADRVAQTASPAFDISVWQFLAAPLVGATVHIFPDEVAHDPRRLLQAVADQSVTLLQVVPSMLRQLVRVAPGAAPQVLRWVLSIGEALPPQLALDWFERFPGVQLINIYGPAECADNVAFLAVRDAAQAESYAGLASVPIGRPTANNQLFILDEQLLPAPIGVPGEICVAGTGVGRGYLDDAEATARAFVDHPFQAGARLYRTGDRGRWRADGGIDYLGRRDHQVKVRGQRIELGEIEARLGACIGVAVAAVVARADAQGESQLLAYWVPAEAAAADAGALREALAASLPQAMIPAGLVALEELPLNANGKVDRKALAALPWEPEERAGESPVTATEQQLQAIWATLLGTAQAGRDNNFFHLGGHSLLATQLVSRIHQAFQVALPLREVFEAPTLRQMALRIEQGRPGSTDEPPPTAVDRRAPLPLSFSQQRLWFLDQLEPGSALYNMPGGVRLQGLLDADALHAALNDLVGRHEVLRTSFERIGDEAAQRVQAQAAVPFVWHDLSTLEPAERRAEAHRLAADEAARPFDLKRAPMLRAQLLRLGPHEHWLLLTLHHIAADGWSTGILLRELAAFYRARRQGAAAELPPLPVQYADFAVWQRAWLQGERLERQLAYWRTQLDGAPALLELPADHPRPTVPSRRGGRVAIEIGAALADDLLAISRHHHVTLFTTLASAFALLLGRCSNQTEVCLGIPVANRQRAELEGLIGFFVNTVVLRLRLDGEATFPSLLRQTHETVLSAQAHQDLPFEQLVQALRPERHLGHSPLFQAMFLLDGGGDTSAVFDSLLDAEPLEVQGPPIAKFDLTLHVTPSGQGLRATFEYSADLFARATIERLAGHLRTLLQGIVERPEQLTAELPLLSAQERQQLLVEWNQTHTALPERPTIHAMFEACAHQHATRIALVFEDQRITYGELNIRANRLAHRLRARGVGPDTLVAVCMARGPAVIVAVLAVLKAGGAYLPLDPALPAERLGYLVEDAQPSLLLSLKGQSACVASLRLDCVFLDDGDEMAWPDAEPGPLAEPGHLAYVIYTSGSTGRPKGTLIHHRGLVNLALAQRQALDLHIGVRVLQWASFTFDASVCDIFATLTTGARLYLAPSDSALAGQELLATLQRHQIELVTLTPSTLATLPLERLPDLRTLVVAGEHLDHALIAPWLKHCTVINAYGPTEATVCATVYPCAADGQRHPPIGRPIANTQVYIVDARLQPVPIGVTGELHIGGEGLARGYLGRPDLTAERFIQNPFGGQPGARMYKTGDLARYHPDGQIEYMGRADQQVKVRGFRIEPGEIEFALAQMPEVREAVVLAPPAPGGGRQLVACVTAQPGAEPTAATLRSALRRSLPGYMVPAHFVVLRSLPVNTNGKVDRQALSALQWVGDGPGHAPPATPTEERLATLWAELLGRERIGRDEHFFHIGGHSLLAVRLNSRVNGAFGVSLPLSQLFLSPSIAMLGEVIDARSAPGRLVVPLKPGHPGARAKPIWLIHPSGGTVFCYRGLADRLAQWDGTRPVHAIQSAEVAGLDEAPTDFESLCGGYAAEILHLQSTGPFHLAGWSMGGAIAWRIAGLLEHAGHEVGWVAVFDTLQVQDRKPQQFSEFVAWAASHFDGGASADAAQAADVAFLRRQHDIQLVHAGLMRGVVPGRIKAPVHAFHATASSDEPGTAQVDWLSLTATPEHSTQRTLPGRHENVILLPSNVELIAQALIQASASPT